MKSTTKKILWIISVILIIAIGSLLIYKGIVEAKKRTQYNELSTKHEQVLNEAIAKNDLGISKYNEGAYQDAKSAMAQAKQKYEEALAIDKDSLDLARKFSGKSWLVDYKEKLMANEQYRIDYSIKIEQAADAQIQSDTSKARNLIEDSETIKKKIDQINEQLSEIEKQHPDFFHQ